MLWADSFGAKYVHSKLEQWTKQYGNFFKPCAYLAERAAKGISLVQTSLSLSLNLAFMYFACKLYIRQFVLLYILFNLTSGTIFCRVRQ